MQWIAAGWGEAQFWASTPRQIAIHFDAVAVRVKREHDASAWQAWHVAALSRMKKMPPLSSLMNGKTAPRDKQTWQEQRGIARMLNAIFGGTDVEREGPTNAN